MLKVKLFVALIGLLMAGCGEQTQKEIKAKAEAKLLGLDDHEGLLQAVNLSFLDEIPHDYTGWISNHGVRVHLTPYKNGKIHGLRTGWYGNRKKDSERYYKEGKLTSAVAWKPSGEKCPISNITAGNGFLVTYNGNGQEISRTNFKNGKGVQTIRTSINSFESEFERKHRLAQGGDNIAEFDLGLMYENGDGIPLDFSGDPSLRKMTRLSIRTLHLKEAEKWYVKSAKKGNSDAMFNLGVMYHNEEAPKDNPYIAYAWFRAAKENGHEQAEINLDILTAKMTKEQIEQARSLSTEIYKRIEANRED
jgi:TPR repeat protein